MRSAQEIFDETNELARDIYSLNNAIVPHGYDFSIATHPLEVMCWKAACLAQEMLTGTNLTYVMDELGED